MKKFISLLVLILIVFEGKCSFAIEDRKVISTTDTQKELMRSFNNVNQYTNSFFTPKTYLTDEEVYDAKKIKNKFFSIGNPDPKTNSIPPLKKLRLTIYEKRHPEIVKQSDTSDNENAPLDPKNTMELSCDKMEYFAERTELEATGDVVITFPQNDTILKADKLIYNQTSNIINAIDNVVIISGDQEMHGDFLQIDMNEETAFMDNPLSDIRQIHCVARKGYLYGDKIIQEQGKMYITDHMNIDIKSDMFGPDLDRMVVANKDKSSLMDEPFGTKLKIKVNDIILNSTKEHDTIRLKHASIYFKDKKIGTIPGITLHTNKNRDYVEGNYPEIGTLTNMGLYVGPGFVFDTPHGSTLKLVPIFNYQSGAEDNMFGFGGIAKYKSATNYTDVAYGTTNKTFLMRGRQNLDDNLYLQYGSNMYIDDWFMGYRMPRLMGELVYHESFLHNDFIAKNRDLVYTNRITAGYAQDGIGGYNSEPLGEDGIGTMRVRYMGELSQNVLRFNDEARDLINARFDIVAQGLASVYGTGDTQFIGRIGPFLHSQYKIWMQDLGYFFSAYSDDTPLINYDRFRYGVSNAYLRESIRLNKYLTLSWLGSFNLSGDAPDGNLIQENAFFLGIGPDDIKLNIGYDTVRQQSFVTMSMHLDAKGAEVDYDKLVVKNPDKFGKNPKEQKTYYNPNFQATEVPLKEGLEKTVEHAEVIDITDGEL